MLCYKDKTFCSQSCANTKCSLNLNDDVWGKEGAPICIADFRTDECGFIELRSVINMNQSLTDHYKLILGITPVPESLYAARNNDSVIERKFNKRYQVFNGFRNNKAKHYL